MLNCSFKLQKQICTADDQYPHICHLINTTMSKISEFDTEIDTFFTIL